MGIKNYILDLQPYCDNCPEFSVHARSETVIVEEPFTLDPHYEISTVITCEHQKRCANMVKWLEKSKGEKKV